jgi:hypothetical protein
LIIQQALEIPLQNILGILLNQHKALGEKLSITIVKKKCTSLEETFSAAILVSTLNGCKNKEQIIQIIKDS